MSTEPSFEYLDVRPCDVEVPSESPISQEEWLSNRMMILNDVESWVQTGFRGRAILLMTIQQHGGLDAFKRRWINLVDEGHAANVLARAARETSQGFEALDFVDLLTDSYASTHPEKKNIKWPMNVSVMFPELSPWVLAPDSTCSEKVFDLLERECPELTSDRPASGDDIDKQTWSLFMENGKLCERPESPDQSLLLMVRKTEMRAAFIQYGSARLFALGMFLSVLVEESREACDTCRKTGEGMKRCSRCHCAVYCDRACQAKHFKSTHKKQCAELKALRDRYKEAQPLPEHDYIGVYMTLETFMFPHLRDKHLGPVKTVVMEKLGEKYPEIMEKYQD